MGALKKYKPLLKTRMTVLERQIEALNLPTDVEILTPVTLPSYRDAHRMLVPVDPDTTLKALLAEVDHRIQALQGHYTATMRRINKWESDDDLDHLWGSDAEEDALGGGPSSNAGRDDNDAGAPSYTPGGPSPMHHPAPYYSSTVRSPYPRPNTPGGSEAGLSSSPLPAVVQDTIKNFSVHLHPGAMGGSSGDATTVVRKILLDGGGNGDGTIPNTVTVIPPPLASAETRPMITDGAHHSLRQPQHDVLFSTLEKTYIHDLWQLPAEASRDMRRSEAALRSLWIEFYRSLYMLESFSTLNQLAIEHILTRHDKTIKTGSKHRFIYDNMYLLGKSYSFFNLSSLRALMSETEHVYAQALANGNHHLATRELQMLSEHPISSASSFTIGLLLGLATFYAVILIVMLTLIPTIFPDVLSNLLMMRSALLMMLYLLSWHVQTYFWTHYRISYNIIFNLSPSRITSPLSMIRLTLLLLILTLTCSTLIVIFEHHSSPHRAVLRTVLVAVVFLSLLGVLGYVRYTTRGFTLKSFIQDLSLLHTVTYSDYYLASIASSAVLILYDISGLLCMAMSSAPLSMVVPGAGGGDDDDDARLGLQASPILRCLLGRTWPYVLVASLPHVWKAAQCTSRYIGSGYTNRRHLWHAVSNASPILTASLAYCMTAFDRLGNFWTALWALSLIHTAAAMTYYDVVDDWSLMNPRAKIPYLRNKLLFPTYWYFTAVLMAPLARLSWALLLSYCLLLRYADSQAMNTYLAVIEVIRFTIWSLLRTENEQTVNSDNTWTLDWWRHAAQRVSSEDKDSKKAEEDDDEVDDEVDDDGNDVMLHRIGRRASDDTVVTPPLRGPVVPSQGGGPAADDDSDGGGGSYRPGAGGDDRLSDGGSGGGPASNNNDASVPCNLVQRPR